MGQEVRDGYVTKVEVKEGIHSTRAGKRRPVRITLEGPARPRLGIRSGAFPRVKVGCHIQQGNSFRVVGLRGAVKTGDGFVAVSPARGSRIRLEEMGRGKQMQGMQCGYDGRPGFPTLPRRGHCKRRLAGVSGARANMFEMWTNGPSHGGTRTIQAMVRFAKS